MSLSDLASLGSFVSGVAVVVTLIFLLLQMRQSDKNQRAAMRMGRATRANNLFAMMADPDTARVLAKAFRGEDLGDDEAFIHLTVCHGLLTNFEDTYFQYRAGLLDKAVWETEDAIVRNQLSQPSFRAMWQFVRIMYGEEFRRYIGDIIEQVPLFQPGGFASPYNMMLHEQLAQAKPFIADEDLLRRALGLAPTNTANPHRRRAT